MKLGGKKRKSWGCEGQRKQDQGTGDPFPSSLLGAPVPQSTPPEGLIPQTSGFCLEDGMQPTPSLASSKGRELDGYEPDAIFPELPPRGDRKVSEVSVDKPHRSWLEGRGLSRALLDVWPHPGAHPGSPLRVLKIVSTCSQLSPGGQIPSSRKPGRQLLVPRRWRIPSASDDGRDGGGGGGGSGGSLQPRQLDSAHAL